MKFLTSEEANARLENPKNILVDHRFLHDTKGRKNGSKNLTHDQRVLVGTIANMTTAKEASKITGVNPMSAHLYSNGKTSVEKFDETLKQDIDERIGDVKDKALNLLMKSMGLISDEDLVGAKLLEKTAVIRDMSGVIDKLTPKNKEQSDENHVHFHIHGPELTDESKFAAIEVSAKEVK